MNGGEPSQGTRTTKFRAVGIEISRNWKVRSWSVSKLLMPNMHQRPENRNLFGILFKREFSPTDEFAFRKLMDSSQLTATWYFSAHTGTLHSDQ